MANHQGNTMHGAGGDNAMVQGDIKADIGANVNFGIQVNIPGMDTKETGKLLYDILGKFSNAPLEKFVAKGKEFSNAKVEPQIVEFNSLTDSEPRLQRILALIEDVGIRKIGIWGMGGIGKTRTLKLLNNQLGESHMFDIVIWVTVSREGSRRKVQNDIAGRLNCIEKDMSDDDRLRASISKNLSGMKFLLILDDIWERIDLCDVGVPILNQDNGCKVLLTTRALDVCRQMETDVEIQMEKLSEDEAWSLFNEKAGDVAMSPSIQPIARDIVKKCSGLPLAIIVIGSSLRKISYVGGWRNTLRKLQLPSTSQIKGMEKEVFSCLRISYDRLPNDFERSLFLYCSLYPEDQKIRITELVEYCWLEGYIQEVDSIDEAQDDGQNMVMNLVDASLLERGYNEIWVKMHDIIRDFALNEASGYLVKSGKHVKHPLEEKEWLQSQKISLMRCGLDCLLELERPNCGSLSTLFLQENIRLTMIPDSFFECMHSLCILDLSWTRIKSLPSSLCNLVNLRGLYLNNCSKLEELPFQVGALTQLKVLDLEHCTTIKYLPREVEKLTCLCILDLTWTEIKSLPSSLCNLVNLRSLYLNNCSKLEELPFQVGALTQLKVLHLEGCRTIKYLPREVEKLTCLCILDLSRTNIRSLPSSLWNLVNLRSLYLNDCDKLEELPSEVGALTQLKVLHLGGSTAIKYLPREVEKLTCLKRLIVGFKKCERGRICLDTEEWNIKLRVPTGIIPNLRYLEELGLYRYGYFNGACVDKEQWDDESMEAVVEEICRLEHLTDLDAYFPKVECLEHFLHHSKLVKATSWFRRFRFRVGTQIRDVSDSDFKPTPQWERCLVYNGGFGTSHAAIMKTLAHSSFLHLDDHRTARKLSELGLANMNELKECLIQDCEKMETLFDGDEQQEACAVLPILETLKIWDLPELRSLCDGPLVPESLSKLTSLTLSGCKNLKKVFQLGIIRQLCSLEYLEVINCSAMKEIIEIEEEDEMSVASHTHNVISYNNDRLILPNIKLIFLFGLPELVSIWRGFSNFEWPSLETIDIGICPKLKSLSFLSNGTNIVAPALNKIDGESEWWEALEWEDNDIKQRLQPFFSPFAC